MFENIVIAGTTLTAKNADSYICRLNGTSGFVYKSTAGAGAQAARALAPP